jgi:hypothetical protein
MHTAAEEEEIITPAVAASAERARIASRIRARRHAGHECDADGAVADDTCTTGGDRAAGLVALAAAVGRDAAAASHGDLPSLDPAVWRHGCTHNGPGRGHEETHLTYDDQLAAWQCFRDAFARHQPGAWHAQPAHACDSSCPMLIHRNVYTCCWSGNFHLCNAMACRLAVAHVDGRVCPLSGLTYALDFEATFEQGAPSAAYRRDTHIAPPKRARRRGGTDGLSVATTPAATARPTTQERLRAARQADRVNDPARVRACVDRLVPTLTTIRRAEIVREVLTAWDRVVTTPAFLALRSNTQYTLEAHTLVCVHAMAQAGIVRERVVFLRAHADLRDPAVMPHIDEAARRIGTKSARDKFKDNRRRLEGYANQWCAANAMRINDGVPRVSAFR